MASRYALTGLHPAEFYPLVPPERMKLFPVAKMADILDRCGDPDPSGRFQDIGEMTLLGFLVAGFDDASPRMSLVLTTFEAHGWFPAALHFLDAEGTLTATYWYPGHIHPQDFVLVRETPDSPPMLAFKAVNNHLGKRFQELEPGRQKFHCTFALLDPRATGHHEAPPGNGLLNGHDDMTVFYRALEPQWAAINRIRTQDTTRDGRNELIIWPQFGSRTEFTTERINCGHVLDFQDNQLAIQPGNGHIAESLLVDPETIDAW